MSSTTLPSSWPQSWLTLLRLFPTAPSPPFVMVELLSLILCFTVPTLTYYSTTRMTIYDESRTRINSVTERKRLELSKFSLLDLTIVVWVKEPYPTSWIPSLPSFSSSDHKLIPTILWYLWEVTIRLSFFLHRYTEYWTFVVVIFVVDTRRWERVILRSIVHRPRTFTLGHLVPSTIKYKSPSIISVR